ncbi:zinc finger protein 492-like isoform X2 [Sitophilus oryzae]|uniref:Zinc finger protein 492-like isoform X2 n=1 Tax=Sitophilus oryzae TaxID=7048 RepID=A0A6J2YS09_SITOR|nr:zinc finger protein 492-like isoform X2 [Sitophilus oryzae]
MDTEDSYLKYLNDSETQNAFLLETSEVAMFSEEPIFTEIDTADWPPDSFPLLLTNPLITENVEDQVSGSDDTNGRTQEDEGNHNLDATLCNTEVEQQNYNTEELIFAEKEDIECETEIVQLDKCDKTLLTSNKSVLKSANKQHTVKNVNDLFSTVIANKCKICSYLCENLEQIKAHIAEKHLAIFNGNGISVLAQNQQKNNGVSEIRKEYTVYVCSVCHDVCTNKDDLRQHMIQTHKLITEPEKEQLPEKEENKSPSVIYRKSSVLGDLTVNMMKRQERSLQKIKCSVKGCNAGFPTEEVRKKHEALHCNGSKSTFKCSECDQKFKMWRIARNHMYQEHKLDFGMVSCPMCNTMKSYSTVNILKHMVIHSDEKPFLCSECGKAFKQWNQLKNHEVIHKVPEELPSWCKVKKCDTCQRFFANMKCLKTHIKSVHENFKPFICNICGHKTTRKYMLELHLRQHTGAKPHQCDFCPYKTGDYNCLRKHALKHVGGYRYKCPHCPYTCIQSGSFKYHLTNKHKGKGGTLSCTYCSYTTINPTFLEAHEKKHSEVNGSSGTEVLIDDKQTNHETDLQADEETQNCFLNTEHIEETVDNGGITIPAGLETSMNS